MTDYKHRMSVRIGLLQLAVENDVDHRAGVQNKSAVEFGRSLQRTVGLLNYRDGRIVCVYLENGLHV